MIIEHVPPASIDDAWEEVAEPLARAMRFEPTKTPEEVRGYLKSGRMELARLSKGEATGLVVTELCVTDGEPALWICYLAADVPVMPREWLRIARDLMRQYETMARRAGCRAIYLSGRDWSRVFPDFQPSPDAMNPNRMRKAI